jgi:cysteine desulfurase family protein
VILLAIYLNNAATTWPKPEPVAKAMYDFLLSGGANLARGSASRRDLQTLGLVGDVRERLARFLGGHEKADPRYVTFALNVTEALNVVFKGFLRPGMKVVTTSMEHNAVIRPLRRLEAEGLELTVLPCDKTGRLEPRLLQERLREPADLFVLSHASNLCGTVQDLESLAEVCRRHGVPLVVDAAQTAGLLPLDVASLDVAALCFTGHKGLLGPQGTGGIVWRPDFAQKCRPLVEGGTGSRSHEERQPEMLPDKFESGTPNLPGLAGLRAALVWLEEEGIEAVRLREERLGSRLLDGLKALPGVTLYGLAGMEGRLPVFALNLKSIDNGTLAGELAERWGIETRPGLHCAPLAHRTVGSFPEGALRLSPGCFNTEEEIDLCLEALKKLA